MAKFRKIPVVVDAIRFRGDNVDEVRQWVKSVAKCWPDTHGNEDGDFAFATKVIVIPTREGHMTVRSGEYIICGVDGEFYPCKPEIFSATYEPVEV
jgi:hypothetical protein